MCCAVVDRMKSIFVQVLFVGDAALFVNYSAAADGYRAFGSYYSVLEAVVRDQSQVVHHCSEKSSRAAVPNMFLEKEVIVAPKPGGNIAFCVATSRSMLRPYLDDAPTYTGKNDESYTATVFGGVTTTSRFGARLGITLCR